MSQPVRVRSVVDEHREQVMGARRRHPSVSPETASALLDAYYAVQKVRSHLDSTVGPLIRRHRSAGFAFGRDAAVRAIRAQMLKLLMIDRPDFSPGLTETAREDQAYYTFQTLVGRMYVGERVFVFDANWQLRDEQTGEAAEAVG